MLVRKVRRLAEVIELVLNYVIDPRIMVYLGYLGFILFQICGFHLFLRHFLPIHLIPWAIFHKFLYTQPVFTSRKTTTTAIVRQICEFAEILVADIFRDI